MITAKKAQRKSIIGEIKAAKREKRQKEEKAIKHLIQINRDIKDAVNRGAMQMSTNIWLEDNVIASLKNRGFIVEEDRRWGNTYTIKWSDEQ
ncbi:MAG: hypothetical protein J6S70_00130 [Clostridia bacterium]|nr:hypothetical protein [Clostridia bacterium]